jgi:hypothetical protein
VALPRTAIGAGIGAAFGAGTGALAGGKNHRLSGAIGGAAAGGAAGFGIHGAARLRALPKNMMASGARAERATALAGRATDDAAKGAILQQAGRSERFHQAFLGRHKSSETLAHLQKSNPFQGLDTQAAKKLHRQQAMKLHPDRGGNAEAFGRMQEQYKNHTLQFGTAKRADAGLDSYLWDGFFKEAMSLSAPAAKAFKPLKAMSGGIPGKLSAAAGSSGKGQVSVLGRSGVSGAAAPTPPPIVS